MNIFFFLILYFYELTRQIGYDSIPIRKNIKNIILTKNVVHHHTHDDKKKSVNFTIFYIDYRHSFICLFLNISMFKYHL